MNPPETDNPDSSKDTAARIPQDAPPVAQPVPEQDEEIFCPICNYNLTGNRSGKCSECGSLFHLEALIAAQKSHRITLIPWDDPEGTRWWTRLRATLAISLFKADRFADAFSVQPRRSRVLSYFATCLAAVSAMAVVVLWLITTTLGASSPDFSERGLGVAVATTAFVTVSIGLTTAITSIVLWASYPHYDGRRHLRPWLAIVAYASSHYLLIVWLIPFTVLLILFGYVSDVGLFVGVMAFFTWIGCGTLCAFTLTAVVRHRTADDRRGLGGLLLVFLTFLFVPIVFFFAVGLTLSLLL